MGSVIFGGEMAIVLGDLPDEFKDKQLQIWWLKDAVDGRVAAADSTSCKDLSFIFISEPSDDK